LTETAEGASLAPFTYRSRVYYDELDMLGMLHNTRFAVHVEHAQTALYLRMTGAASVDFADPDQFVVVQHMEMEFVRPFVGIGDMWVDIWIRELSGVACKLGYTCRTADDLVYARGSRTLVKRSRQTLKPTAWSEDFRAAAQPYVWDDGAGG